jgi:ribosomal protein S20
MRRRAHGAPKTLSREGSYLAHSQRGWTGARTPSAIKRVRQTARKRAINQPRRTAAKSLVARALETATLAQGNGGSTEDVTQALQRAISALDRAAKIGAIHRNAADRRKSRLVLKVNAALSGTGVTAPKVARTTGKAAAVKEAKARIAASRATKAKGAQTAAGKARAALARTSRDTTAEKPVTAAAKPVAAAKGPAKGKAAAKASPKSKPKSKPAAKAGAKPATKTTASKSATKPAAKASSKK